jgi:hypothetical protein
MNIGKVINIRCESHSNISIHELEPFQGKLKTLTKDKLDDLKNSLIKDGLPLALHVWRDEKGKNWILDGHTRITALKSLEDDGYFVPPIPVNIVQAKSKKDAAQIVLIANSRYSRMDETSLGNYMIEMELNLPDINLLDLIDIDMSDFKVGEDINPEDDDTYTRKVETPIYEPKGDKPELHHVYDKSKSDSLIDKINSSSLDQELKEFLIYSSYRHVKFNYKNIAELYAHQSKEAKELFEESALVIIDFDKAIELGFVKLTEKMKESITDDEE